jgi:methionyl-tRNA formyltransferase
MNILYIGSSGALSLLPFKKLLSSQHLITAVGIFNPIVFNDRIIALKNESLALAANHQNIPVIDLSQSLNDILQQVTEISVDVIVISCYSKRLPEEVVNLASKGCFNMHPSLLPRYRGPEPIFWQMKEASETGISWHTVVHDFDAGDIVAQQKINLHDGAKYSEVSLQLAETGAEIMMSLLTDLSTGSISKTAQDPEQASYFPYPEKQDFVIDTSCTARHVYNFMCATKAFGYPYRCLIGKHCYFIDEALAYDNNATLQAVKTQGNRLYIPCNEGVLIAAYTGKLFP